MAGVRWLMRQRVKDGPWEVLKGRKQVGVHDDHDRALEQVTRERADGDTAHREEPDGYRTNITRSTRPRKGWRADIR